MVDSNTVTGKSSPLLIVGAQTSLRERDAVVRHFAELTGRSVENWEGREMPPPSSSAVYCTGGPILSPSLLASCPTVFNIRLHPSLLHDLSAQQEAQTALQSSRYDVVVGPEDFADGQFIGAEKCAKELARLVDFARKPHPSPHEVKLLMGKDTFFLSLTFKDLKAACPLLSTVSEGSDALELRVDILDSHAEADVLLQLRLLREHSKLPVIFTVRSLNQCGTFPDDPSRIFPLLEAGLRGGIEILDFETCWPDSFRDKLLTISQTKYAPTILMPSFHVVGRKTSMERARELFLETYHNGRVDAVKVVLTAFESDDSWRVHAVAQELSLPVPVIALCLGEKGQLSRVLNRCFTPVTHRSLPFIAAPGQLSAGELMQFRKSLGIVPKRNFFLLGSPISASPSPDMHNAGFKACDLPHTYGLLETEDVELFADAIKQENFGGASVTIPHKQNVAPYLQQVGPAAEAIGAINTIIVGTDPLTGQRVLRGENTDWLGITRVISRLLNSRPASQSPLAALVIGGGGTSMAAAYAMQQLGCKLGVYNRTPEKAQAISEKFGGSSLTSLEPDAIQAAFRKNTIDIIVSTIPASAEFTVPQSLLESKPVVLDAAYKPPKTALLAQAIAAGCPNAQGAEMLIEQGLEQFQFWTERLAPSDQMRNAVYKKVEKI